jgi:hypothetical protein
VKHPPCADGVAHQDFDVDACCSLCLCLFPAGINLSSPDLSSATEDVRDVADNGAAVIQGAASTLKAKVKEALKSLSAMPNSLLATVADQNAYVCGLAHNYKDHAERIQQDKATGGWLATMCSITYTAQIPAIIPYSVVVCCCQRPCCPCCH